MNAHKMILNPWFTFDSKPFNIILHFLYFSFTAEDKEIVRRQMEIVESQLPEGFKTDF